MGLGRFLRFELWRMCIDRLATFSELLRFRSQSCTVQPLLRDCVLVCHSKWPSSLYVGLHEWVRTSDMQIGKGVWLNSG